MYHNIYLSLDIMPHKCLRCGKIYENNDSSILKGCKCGSVFFMYYRAIEDTQYLTDMEEELKVKDTTLEKELDKGIKKRKFDIETIRSPVEGIYEINIQALMKKKPLIILEKGRAYIIHLPSVFEKYEK